MTHTATINFYGLDIEVTYDYYPAEPATRCYADGTGYPGCGESFEINGVMLGGYDLMELVEKYKMFDDIEEKIRTAEKP